MCKDPVKHIEEFQKNIKWYYLHFGQLLKDYRDMFVAIANESVVAGDKDIVKLRNKVDKKGIDITSVYVDYVSHKPLDMIL